MLGLKAINEAALATMNPAELIVETHQVQEPEAELDEMWSYVGSKKKQCWSWHAIDHITGTILAYSWVKVTRRRLSVST